MKVTGIVLAGGASSRMGTDKSQLRLDGMTVLERIAGEVRKAANRVIVTGSKGGSLPFGLEAVPDQYPGQGPLAGLHAGLKETRTEWSILCACDMPLVNAETMLALLTLADEPWNAVIPVIGGRKQPLLAAYHHRVLPGLEERLQAGRLRMQDWLDTISAVYVDGEQLAASGSRAADKVFFNMNEPEDYRRVTGWLREEASLKNHDC
ncbi:molybdenum cofactor guanylyltransferase [Paenibacillus sp. P96]|uniref:Probable molybdenum cofactor guanylyltransferase n=1 Tax=Paenibacillus zeirhizosphaerae TaxID=2987519 RepID=A0ABT9FN09_9BACL|nr:molybdenum cofactor guanylyltransferase [Paenibacillus sp. P96]MDP4096124.1 molybdenum cofactor guanylyltransferase [Paenibacillus sp. P96]